MEVDKNIIIPGRPRTTSRIKGSYQIENSRRIIITYLKTITGDNNISNHRVRAHQE